MSDQKPPPVCFKDQVGSVVNPNESDGKEQQQQDVASDPPPAQYATWGTDTGSTDSSRPKLHMMDEGQVLLPRFKDQTRTTPLTPKC